MPITYQKASQLLIEAKDRSHTTVVLLKDFERAQTRIKELIEKLEILYGLCRKVDDRFAEDLEITEALAQLKVTSN